MWREQSIPDNKGHEWDILDVRAKPVFAGPGNDTIVAIKTVLEYVCSRCERTVFIFPDRPEPSDQSYPAICGWAIPHGKCPVVGKLQYPTPAAGRAATITYQKQHGAKMHTFLCKYCKYYHLTHWLPRAKEALSNNHGSGFATPPDAKPAEARKRWMDTETP